MHFIKKSAIAAAILPMLISGAAQATEYITNGTFNNHPDDATYSQTGWTVNSGKSLLLVPNDFFLGNHFNETNDFSPGSLSQTVTDTKGTLVLSFNYGASGLVASTIYESVVWNGITLKTIAGVSGMQNYSFNVQGTGNDTLTFMGMNNSLLLSANMLSNVSLTPSVSAVPEPETYAMLLAGLGLMGFMARRKSGKKAA